MGFDYIDKTNTAALSSKHTVETMSFREKVFGQLVMLGFDVTVFTPASYQRRSLQRPSKEI